jgi:hypothetical protein
MHRSSRDYKYFNIELSPVAAANALEPAKEKPSDLPEGFEQPEKS